MLLYYVFAMIFSKLLLAALSTSSFGYLHLEMFNAFAVDDPLGNRSVVSVRFAISSSLPLRRYIALNVNFEYQFCNFKMKKYFCFGAAKDPPMSLKQL